MSLKRSEVESLLRQVEEQIEVYNDHIMRVPKFEIEIFLLRDLCNWALDRMQKEAARVSRKK